MATTRKSTAKAAETVEETPVAEPTVKQTVNAGIDRVAEALGVESKDRYKVQRAIFFIAARNAIEDGTFEDLLEATIADAGELPVGFGLERSAAAPKAPAKAKAAAKAPARKAAAKAPAKARTSAPRKRPTR